MAVTMWLQWLQSSKINAFSIPVRVHKKSFLEKMCLEKKPIGAIQRYEKKKVKI